MTFYHHKRYDLEETMPTNVARFGPALQDEKLMIRRISSDPSTDKVGRVSVSRVAVESDSTETLASPAPLPESGPKWSNWNFPAKEAQPDFSRPRPVSRITYLADEVKEAGRRAKETEKE